MFFFSWISIIIIIPFILYATIHEDAEDKKTSRWKLLNHTSSSGIMNREEINKKNRIIEFKGDGTKYAYALKTKKLKKQEHWLSWEMKLFEDFVIIVLVNTNKGEHYLVYTPGTFNGYMQYGLGDMDANKEWILIRRNLQEDIAYFDNRIKILSLKRFVVKGSGQIDNIRSDKIALVKNKKTRKKKKKKKKKKVFKKFTNSLPILKITGSKQLQLNLGDSYKEQGASAYDKEDGEINVVTMENINNHEVGRYMVLYMVTDSDGNMAVDKRYVDIGDVEVDERNEDENIEDDENNEEEEEHEEEYDFSEEKEQIRIWEKELALREKELAQREKNSNKNYKKK